MISNFTSWKRNPRVRYMCIAVCITLTVLMLDSVISSFSNLESNWTDVLPTSTYRKNFVFDSRLGLYTLKGKPPIWLYWQGDEMPTYLKLCIEVLRCYNDEDFAIFIVNDMKLREMVDNIHPAYKYLKLNHRSDYFRTIMIYLFGGIYLDADTLVLSNLKPLYEKLTMYDAVGVSVPQYDEPISTSDMGPFRSGGLFASTLVKEHHAILDRRYPQLQTYSRSYFRLYPLSWTELSIVIPHTMSKLLKTNKIKYYSMHGPSTWLQIAEPNGDAMSKKIEPKDITPTELLTLNNKYAPKSLKRMDEENVLKQDYILTKLLKIEIKKCRKR